MIWESVKIAFSSIWNHKIRSILTMLGIIIGVCAVIIIVALGQGAKGQLTDDLFDMDKNVIELNYEQFPSEDGSDDFYWEMPEVTEHELEQLWDVPGVKAVIGTNMGWGTLIHNEKQGDVEITGVGSEYIRARNIDVVEGRPFLARDIDSMSRIVMIDTEARKEYFKENEDVIGEIIEFAGNPYKVVGVYESPTPEMYRMGGGEALMPRTLVSIMFGAYEIENVSIIAESPDMLVETGNMAAQKLTEIKELEDGEFTTFDMGDIEEEFNTFINTITLFISSIAAISLLVGGIGVMNIMLVSVTERTREIGLRKAIGATRGRILLQFLIESITITSLGGLIGIGMAVLFTFIASQFLPFQATVNPIVVAIGVSFSAVIGIIFGILPANKASKLSPIDALRHE